MHSHDNKPGYMTSLDQPLHDLVEGVLVNAGPGHKKSNLKHETIAALFQVPITLL